MKFSLFAHVERYDGATPWPQLYGELTELVQTAEDGGFAAFWTGEHYGMEFTVGPNPITLLVHLAAQTRRHPARDRQHRGAVLAPGAAGVRGGPGRRADERADRARHRARRLPVRVRPADGRHERDAGRQPPARARAAAAPAVGRRRRPRGRELVVPGHHQRPEADARGRAAGSGSPPATPPRTTSRSRTAATSAARRSRRTTPRSRTWWRSSRRRARRIPRSRARG